MASLKDRTNELLSAMQTIEGRSMDHLRQKPGPSGRPAANELSAPLLGSSAASLPPPQQHPRGTRPKTEFSQRAGYIARAIQQTAAKLEKLGKLAKRRTLFDDRPVEIAELTAVIKQDITALNTEIRALQALSQAHNARSRAGQHEEEHSKSVVVGLQSSLARASQGFAEVLEIRTENMKAQKERRDQFAAGGPAFALAGPAADSPLLSFDQPAAAASAAAPNVFGHPPGPAFGNGNAAYGFGMNNGFAPPASSANGAGTKDFLAIDMGMSADQQQQFAALDQNTAIMEQRGTAIDTIESTMAELGQIFQQLGMLVAQQREQVIRIDDNVYEIENNVDLARKELFKHWTSVSSNRLLMAKVFAVVLVFFFLFVMFL
ncbi:Integral membrane protein SED5 [Blastocladiella emersonii ATCC 22665]|nr:Integral membrane protein SED5 [Blastocladiella emersonii ATCC 22665]